MRKWLTIGLLLLFTLPVMAQIEGDGTEEMVPFASNLIDVQGLRPDGWVSQPDAPGVFLRASDVLDVTAIIMQARTGTAADLLTDFAGSFGIQNVPASEGTIEGEIFTFDYYQLERPQGESSLFIDIAVAESEEDGRVYYVLMQSPSAFYEALNTSVFLPAVQWFGPVERYTDTDETYSINIPTQWTAEMITSEDDLDLEYGMLTNPDDTLTVYVDAFQSEDVVATVETFWQQVDPEFASTYNEATDFVSITDPARLNGLDEVVIIDWEGGLEDSETGIVRQSVARVLGDTVYITLIDTTEEMLSGNSAALDILDRTFTIADLAMDVTGDPPPQAEATPEATAESDE